MAGHSDDKRALILKTQRDLNDRCKTRFAVPKELFQNADGAQAAALTLDLRDGLPGARNPLLCGLGLLVCNDGAYTAENDRGIKHSSATSKTTGTGSAGQFGIGQKAGFRLCDACSVVPPDNPVAFPPFVINPYIDN